MNKIIQGDCLIELRNLPENSVDSIVTDPPYHLVSIVKRFGGENARNTPAMNTKEGGVFARKAKGFMGKEWDGLGEDGIGIANNPLMWAECLRVLKPGGYLLSFGGTRTYHRMACAIEDAGFEVRDMIEWVYGSGFPKSLNIGKAVDKLQGNERETYLAPIAYPDSDCWGKPNSNSKGNDIGFETQGTGTRKDMDGKGNQIKTKGTSEWEGWGTALKPAHEPICLARKPLEKGLTIAENVLKYGTGGINIDESRVGTGDDRTQGGTGGHKTQFVGGQLEQKVERATGARFPANILHDNSEEVRECFPETKSGAIKQEYSMKNNWMPGNDRVIKREQDGDSGNASRFFKSIIYQAKASKSERNKGCEGLETSEKFTAGNYSQSPTCKDCNLTLNGTNDHSECSGEVFYKEMESKNTKNNHPTVKPIALMEYLIKMVTPKGGIVLDPFAGSGSTLVAAKQNGFQYIGIEMTAEYIPIIEARLK